MYSQTERRRALYNLPKILYNIQIYLLACLICMLTKNQIVNRQCVAQFLLLLFTASFFVNNRQHSARYKRLHNCVISGKFVGKFIIARTIPNVLSSHMA